MKKHKIREFAALIVIRACFHVAGVAANAYAAVQAACQEVKLRDETISMDKTVKSCGNVELEDVVVRSGAKLTIDASGEVVFGDGFVMEEGAELRMD